MRIKRLILLVAILVIVLLLYKYPSTQTSEDVETIEDETTDIDLVDVDIKDENLTAFGDLLKINFILKQRKDGKVVDTNNPEIAKEYDIKDYVKGPFSLILGNSGKLKDKAFDKAIVGLKLGEKKTIEIAPTEEKIFLKVERNKERDLYFSIPRYQGLPLKNFEKLFDKEAKIGDIVSNPAFPWSFKIVNMTENNAVGDPILKEGEKYNLAKEPWPVEFLITLDRMIQFKHAPDKKVYRTALGLAEVTASEHKLFMHYTPKLDDLVDYVFSAGMLIMPAEFKVIDITEDEFTLERIDNINDKWLILEAEILERIPDVKFVREESLIKVNEKVR